MEGFNDRRNQGTGHVTDAQLDQFCLRVLRGINRYAARYFGKELTAWQLLIIRIDMSHNVNPPYSSIGMGICATPSLFYKSPKTTRAVWTSLAPLSMLFF